MPTRGYALGTGPGAYVGAADPGPIGADRYWIDTTDPLNPVLKLRDINNTTWRVVVGAVSSVAGKTGTVVLAEADIPSLVADLDALRKGAVFNVKAYGAKGDGATDDTTSIASAVTAASATGGLVYFPPGTYQVSSPLTVTASGVTFAGAGQGASTLRMTSGFSGAAVLIFTGANDGGVRDLQIKGNSATYSSNPAASGIQVNHGSRVAITNVLGYAINGYLAEVISDATSDAYFPQLVNVHSLQCKAGIHLQGTNSPDHNMGAFLSGCNVEQCQNGDGLLIEDVWDVTVVNLEGSCVTGSTVHVKGTGGAHSLSNMDIGSLNGVAATSTPTLLIDSSALGSPFWVGVSNSIIECGTPAGSVVAGSEINFNNCRFAKGGTHGLAVSGSVDRFTLSNCVFDQNGWTAGANHYDLNWGGSGKFMASGCFFTTPLGSGAGQVASAGNSTAGESWWIHNWFYGATAFSSGFPSLARGNAGYNPVGVVGPPAVPASTGSVTNPYGADVTVYVTAGASTCTVIVAGSTVVVIPANGVCPVRVPYARAIGLTYASAPTWVWMGD